MLVEKFDAILFSIVVINDNLFMQFATQIMNVKLLNDIIVSIHYIGSLFVAQKSRTNFFERKFVMGDITAAHIS